MYKNKTMRAAALLLSLTLITTCFVGGTFAKYTTTQTGTDTARVAYWGFNETDTLNVDLFKDTYDNTVDSVGVDGDKVIAPGTSGSTSFNFVYTSNSNENASAPEVDYSFTVAVADAAGTYKNLENLGNFNWKVTLPDNTATEYETFADMVTGLEGLSMATVEANNLPTHFSAGENTIKIDWEWVFDNTKAVTLDTTNTTAADEDVADTALGNMSALENYILDITITATQID